ncbi:RluA family pseudouridine synthase [Mycoplasmopsis felifaucium]|uniref:RluA family pseudouridine synthase n=1 Tax=Mycoplasmopsis felifaucium TaxID=35768 RepID=UPI000482BE03|nr:RluA family pseudouridine synthase [Mycoplasmopsis felifaucium]
MYTLKTTENDAGRKLIKYLQRLFKNVPISHIYRILRKKDIKINNKRTSDENYILSANDEIIIYGLNENDLNLYSYNNELELTSKIIYEDDNILILNKQENIEVHGNTNSLDNQVLAYLKYTQDSSFKPSHVGRLDKETSGLIIYAKNYPTVVELNNKIGEFDKIYKFKSDYKGSNKYVEFYIHHDEKNQRMEATIEPYYKDDKKAITYIFAKGVVWFAKLITGKKHQIRVALKYLGYPIYGDKKYGGKLDKRLYLHSYQLTFKNLAGHLEYLNDKTFLCDIKW